jgi:hypothetical protein
MSVIYFRHYNFVNTICFRENGIAKSFMTGSVTSLRLHIARYVGAMLIPLNIEKNTLNLNRTELAHHYV